MQSDRVHRKPTVPVLDNLTDQLPHHECGANTGEGSAGKTPRAGVGERKPNSSRFGETEGWGRQLHTETDGVSADGLELKVRPPTLCDIWDGGDLYSKGHPRKGLITFSGEEALISLL